MSSFFLTSLPPPSAYRQKVSCPFKNNDLEGEYIYPRTDDSAAQAFRSTIKTAHETIISGWVKMFDKNLVHAIIGGKDLDCGSAQSRVNLSSVNLGLTRGHGSLLLDLYYFRTVGKPEVTDCFGNGLL